MPDKLQPQLATLAGQAPDGPEWLHEIKYDGYRLLASIEGGKVRLITRGGLDWTTKFPELASGGNTAALTFFAFDLLYRDGWDLSGAALEDRKAALAGIILPGSQGMLRYSDH